MDNGNHSSSYSHPKFWRHLWAVLAATLWFGTNPACAQWLAPPQVSERLLSQEVRPINQENSPGQMAVVTGDVRVMGMDEKSYQVSSHALLTDGDVIATGSDGLCRILFADGNFLHVGNNALLRVQQGENGLEIFIWQGRLVAYGMPSWQQKKRVTSLHIPQGRAEFLEAKLGLEVMPDGEKSTVLVFANRVLWRGNDGTNQEVEDGKQLLVTKEKPILTDMDKGREQPFSSEVSPEKNLVKSGLVAFVEEDFARAKTLFAQVQSAFPFNGVAAYHLGLIHVKENNLAEAIQQWQFYNRVDPEGAKKRDVPKNLTLMMSERMKTEVKNAMENEQLLSRAQPEPNSVAVTPFDNKGANTYDILAKGITAMIVTDLAKVPGIKVLERAKIQRLIDEIALSQSGLVSKDSVVRAGKMLKAEKMVIGNYAVEESGG